MEKKTIALAVCITVVAPTIVVAEEFTGIATLNLGDINSQSYLDENFIGSIPILYTSAKEASRLKVRLAPNEIFNDLGVEKSPILNSLYFDIKIRNGQPYVAIRSLNPIDLPFLSFVIEVYGAEGSIYQDYTVLLDPRHLSTKKPASKTIANVRNTTPTALLKKRPKRLRVKSGDTLSTIASSVKLNAITNKEMAFALFVKNPRSFSGNDANKLKTGVTLKIPTLNEVNKLIQEKALLDEANKLEKNINTEESKKVATLDTTITTDKELKSTRYKVKTGDSLSAIARKYTSESSSFSTMMTAIHKANPHAFSKNKVNLLKKGAVLNIPLDASFKTIPKETSNNFEQTNSSFENYTIKKGDSLSAIVHKHGFKGAEASRVMKVIFANNPNAFEKDNITIIKIGEKLRIPHEKNTKSLTPLLTKTDTTLEVAINQPLNSLEKRLREIRKELKSSKSKLFDLNLSLKNKDMLLERQSKEIKSLKKKLSKVKQPKQAVIENKTSTSVTKPTQQIISENKLSVSEIVTYSSLALFMGLILLRIGRQKYVERAVASDDYIPTVKIDPQLPVENLDFSQTLTENEKVNNHNISNLSIQEAEQLVEELVDELNDKLPDINNEKELDSSLDSWISDSIPQKNITEEASLDLKADIICSLEKTMERKITAAAPQQQKLEGLSTLEIDLERHLQSINDQIVANKMKDLV